MAVAESIESRVTYCISKKYRKRVDWQMANVNVLKIVNEEI